MPRFLTLTISALVLFLTVTWSPAVELAEESQWNCAAPWSSPITGGPPGANEAVTIRISWTGSTPGLRLRVSLETAVGPRQGVVELHGQGSRRLLLPVRALEAGAAGSRDLTLELIGESPAGLSLRLESPIRIRQPSGPGLSDDDLLEQIDWSIPGLAIGAACLAAGDRAGARKALAAHLRSRPIPWQPAPPTDPVAAREQADRVIAGEVRWVGLERSFPDGRIDWLANHSLGTPQATNEWVWALNRHADLTAIAQTYALTKNERYAASWIRLLRSWISQVPAPSVEFEKPGSAWRRLEAGLRTTDAWLPAFALVRQSPELSDDDLLLFLRACWDHANFLRSARYDPTNHFVFAMSGLYSVGSVLPELRDAATWRKIAGTQLDRLLGDGVLADGSWWELAPGYGQWVCDKLIGVWNRADAQGLDAEITPRSRQALQRLAEWGVLLMAPERTVPRLNDGVLLRHRPESVTALAKRFPDSAILRWLANDLAGQPTVPPAQTSVDLNASGYQVMRTGWSRDDSYLVLDAGALGGWHGHQDALNVVAWFHGRHFLFDNGGFKYDASIWRAWGQTTAAHNTVLVDGLGQIRSWNGHEDPIGLHPAGQPAPRFAKSPTADYGSAWYACGYGASVPQRGKAASQLRSDPATHRREVVFAKGPDPYALVLDTLQPADQLAHRYEVRWHLKSVQWRTADNGRITWTSDPGQPNLAIVSLAGADRWRADSGVTDPEPLGWWFENQNADPVPALTLRHDVTTAGPVRLLTALIPFRADPEACPVLGLDRPDASTAVIRLRDGRTLTIHLTGAATGPGLTIDHLPLPE